MRSSPLAAHGGANFSLEASTLLRCLAWDAIDKSIRGASIERHVVTIVERALPEVSKLIGADKRRQTYEKIEALKGVHRHVEETLAPLLNLPIDIDAVLGARQLLTRILNDPLLRAYAAPWHLAQVRAGFEVVNSKMARLQKDTGSLPTNVSDCKQAIADQLKYCALHSNYLTKRHFAHYLSIADAALEQFLNSVRGRFSAQIVLRQGESGILQKRYPLREVGRQIRLSIPPSERRARHRI